MKFLNWLFRKPNHVVHGMPVGEGIYAVPCDCSLNHNHHWNAMFKKDE